MRLKKSWATTWKPAVILKTFPDRPARCVHNHCKPMLSSLKHLQDPEVYRHLIGSKVTEMEQRNTGPHFYNHCPVQVTCFWSETKGVSATKLGSSPVITWPFWATPCCWCQYHKAIVEGGRKKVEETWQKTKHGMHACSCSLPMNHIFFSAAYLCVFSLNCSFLLTECPTRNMKEMSLNAQIPQSKCNWYTFSIES